MIFIKKYSYLLIFFLAYLGGLSSSELKAQRMSVSSLKTLRPNNVGSKLEKGATRALRREISKKKSTLRNEARVRSKMKNLPKGGSAGEEEYYDPTMEELIVDPEAKGHIEDPNNKTRYVDLFGQWWLMPSELEVNAQLDIARIRDSILAIDSAEFRVPKMVSDNQFVTIFGWHPHFNGNRYKAYNYKLLTAIAYYSYDLDPYTGGYLDSTVIHDFLGGDDPEGGIVPTAHANDCKVLLSVSSHSRDNNIVFFSPDNAEAQQNLIDGLIYLLDTSKADGIEINFEDIPPLYRNEFYKFVKRLSYSIRKVSDTLSVCMSVPAYDPENIFDIGRMKDDIDFFIIKAVNYHEDPNEPMGLVKKPAAPLNYISAAGEEDIRSTVDRYIASIGRTNTNRLILAFPNYGVLWETTDVGFELLDYVPYSEIQYDYIAQAKDSSQIFIDSNYFSFVYRQLDTTWEDAEKTQVLDIIQTDLYYDDVATLKIKYKYLMDMGLGGVGVWPLGYDLGYDQIWNTLESEFTTVEMPELPGFEQAAKVTKAARNWGTVILTVLLFWAIFASAGFCMALFNINARRALFGNGRFRMLYLGFFSLLILLIGMFFGLFVGKTAMLMVGVIVGSFFSYGIIAILNKQQAKAP
jgi:spore germination protein YaaH